MFVPSYFSISIDFLLKAAWLFYCLFDMFVINAIFYVPFPPCGLFCMLFYYNALFSRVHFVIAPLIDQKIWKCIDAERMNFNWHIGLGKCKLFRLALDLHFCLVFMSSTCFANNHWVLWNQMDEITPKPAMEARGAHMHRHPLAEARLLFILLTVWGKNQCSVLFSVNVSLSLLH